MKEAQSNALFLMGSDIVLRSRRQAVRWVGQRRREDGHLKVRDAVSRYTWLRA
jgi:hypothetical protein